MIRSVLALTAALAAAPLAAQPYSRSLVQCGTLMEWSADLTPGISRDARGRALRNAGARYLTAAVWRAREEGVSDRAGYIENVVQEARAEWETHGVTYVLREDYRDWMRYCGGLADHLGFDPIPDR